MGSGLTAPMSPVPKRSSHEGRASSDQVFPVSPQGAGQERQTGVYWLERHCKFWWEYML